MKPFVHISELGLKNSSAKMVPEKSILSVFRSGVLQHTLPVAIAEKPLSINQDIKALIVKDSRVIPEYLGYYFWTFGNRLLPLIVSAGTD